MHHFSLHLQPMSSSTQGSGEHVRGRVMSRRAGMTLVSCSPPPSFVWSGGAWDMLVVAEGQGQVPGWEVSLSGKELSDEQHLSTISQQVLGQRVVYSVGLSKRRLSVRRLDHSKVTCHLREGD